MKKYLLSILCAMFGIVVYAQNEPAITLTVEKTDGSERNLVFAAAEAGHKLQIDWGDGILVETEEIAVDDGWSTSTITGIPVGEGKISIYGDGIVIFQCSSRVDGIQITSVDVSKATSLTELTINANKIASLDVSQNINLKELNCNINPITELDLSANTQLETLNASEMQLSSLNVTANTMLKTLQLGKNNIAEIDLKANKALKTLQIQENKLTNIDLSENTLLSNVSVQLNQLKTLDLSMCESLATVFCQSNQISELKVGAIKTRFNCSGNNLTLATLPAPKPKYAATYVPQNAMQIAETVKTGEKLDLSAQNNITGLADAPQVTTYTWMTESGTPLVKDEDYTEENGVFTFLKTQAEKVICQMETPAFPKFTGDNVFKTTAIQVEEVKEKPLSITLTAEVDGKERELVFACLTPGNTLMIDWGDGNLVETEEIAVDDGWSTSTITGIPVGEGKISIYGDGIVIFQCSSRVDGIQITSVDVSKATSLTELTINANKIASLDVSQNINLKELNCNINPITELDLSANTQLETLNASEMQLSSLDVTANTMLKTLQLGKNNIAEIDLKANKALKTLQIQENKLTNIDLSENTLLSNVSVQLNQLKTLDLSMCESLATVFCQSNQISELKVGAIKTRFNCSGNNLTLATLPAPKPKYAATYVPQNAMQIAETVKTGEKLDLSAQNNITGLADVPQATTYTWKTEDGTTLVAGTDYIEENGVFTFLNKENMTVYCEMTTDAFPKFTGTNVFKTTTTLVEGGNSVESTRNNAPAITVTRGSIQITGLANDCNVKVYNLAGQAIAAQASAGNAVSFTIEPGLYIVTINNISYKVNAQ